MPSVRVPSVLRAWVGGAEVVRVDGATVRAALIALDRAHPGIAARIFDDRGEVRPFIRVFVGDRDATLDTAVTATDELTLVAAIAGGALRDDQIRRYARQILLPDVGGVGQSALLSATISLAESLDSSAGTPDSADAIALTFLAAGGVGALRVASPALATALAATNPDCAITLATDAAAASSSPSPSPAAVQLATLPDSPPWFPASASNVAALAWWRGSLAAVRALAAIACRPAAADDAPPAIAIPADILAAVYAHARAAFPAECCGYLVGPRHATAVDGAITCRNAQADDGGEHALVPARGTDTAFAIAGAELFAFARSFDGPRPARILYHSHTNGRAYLSALDRAAAHPPGGPPMYPVQHVVVGVAATGIVEVAQFSWSDGARELVEVARWSGASEPRELPR